MKQGLTYQLTERKGAADGHSEAVPLSGAFSHIDILEDVDLFSAEISSTSTNLAKSLKAGSYNANVEPAPYYVSISLSLFLSIGLSHPTLSIQDIPKGIVEQD